MTAVELTPILNISDWDASVAWFEKLGFTRGFAWSDSKPVVTAKDGPPTFGAMLWGEIEIFQCLGAQGGRGEHGAWIAIFVDDVDAVHRRCVEQGIEITREPVDEVWGIREFHVRHPDGHVFRIGAGTDEES
jgi:catechol 2,3-dioxygenase-like lactoylglutathione lyase family enzyme